MKLTHKKANDFIKKYNSDLSLKGYSKLNLKDKDNLIKKTLNNLMDKKKRNTLISEYKALIGDTSEPKKEPKKQPKKEKKVVEPKKKTPEVFQDTIPSPPPKKKMTESEIKKLEAKNKKKK